MSSPRLSLADKKAIIEAYRGGEPIKAIAERFGVHETYPTLLAKRRGMALRVRHVSRGPRTLAVVG